MSPDIFLVTAILGLVIVSALLQRVTGLGFAMVTAPFLVVLIGPHGGVMLTNMLSVIAPLIMVFMVWEDIEWRRLLHIAPVAILVMPLCGWLAAMAPTGPLYMVVAGLVVFGLCTSLILSRNLPVVDGVPTRVLTGVGCGAGVVFAGVGGPAMTIYLLLSRWDIRSFAATVQPLWLLLSVGGFLTKITFSGEEIPVFPWWFWVMCLAGILVGMWLGTAVRHRVSELLVRRVMIVLAIAGAVLAFITGVQATFF
ncbi:sulfite exporter TauE/SafE family protein [Nesterenkonia alba]|uniref:sulfite exporter TauE/SafE family protein n=1 Tax=Nesterenkonia alba TaxID=515814 RepID=UPI0003B37F06|nr:sulfite exporter TauE/SafE family protein [Nesterenkonia alba]